LVRGAGHRGDDDRNFIAGIDLALDVSRGVADAVDVSDRRSTELHDKASHDDPTMIQTAR
jgi:hypothetical protein